MIGLYTETNFGDPIIAYSVEWLFLSQLKIDSIERFDLNPSFTKIIDLPLLLAEKCKVNVENVRSKLLEIYFSKILSDHDLVVVVGGGLIKYKYQYDQLALPIMKLLTVSQKKKITVVLNAIGVEGYDSKSTRCLRIKDCLSEAVLNGTLKYISTRDDIETLQKYIPQSYWKICKKVADPAVWISEAFGIKKQSTDTIGIGVIRERIFLDNGFNFSPLQLFNLYIHLVLLLKAHGFESIELFTNGQYADNLFAKRLFHVLTQMGVDSIHLKIPNDARELVKAISSYKGVLTARLHSCIISYSLGVPFIGMVWNEKLKFFGESVKMEKNFIDIDRLRPEVLVQRLEEVLATELHRDNKYRETVREYIFKIGIDELS
ncbi:polysaccharide pyruvyl transferase family protein [Parasutterella secunda]|uniref:polysaccharide pyruvyl transferase family protein n=1 Tax=Parasutterella secunda TaxID=626947 RepID=UPI0025A3A33E|nr:polysaccharide pyruvyl transferase family protein [Parasutterella secunda]